MKRVLTYIIISIVFLYSCSNIWENAENVSVKSESISEINKVDSIFYKHIYIGTNEAYITLAQSELIKGFDSISKFENLILDIYPDSSYKYETFELLAQLRNLRELKLRFNPDEIYISGLSLLKNIESIDLSGFSDKYFADLSSLNKIKRVHFEWPFIDTIPDILFTLDSLEVLSFNSGYVGFISKEIGNLKRLREFTATKTKINKIPKEIGNLSNLRKLQVSGAYSLQSIPPELGMIENLEVLILWRNKLKYIPREISNLHKLKYLDIGDNDFSLEEVKRIKHMFPNTKIKQY